MKLYDKVYVHSRGTYGYIVDIVKDRYTVEKEGNHGPIFWLLPADDLSPEKVAVEWRHIKRKKAGHWKVQTLEDLYQVLRQCWRKETAYPSCQSEWVSDDPSYGQCAITAMLVYDMFGGSIHRIRVDGGGTHYFNKIDGHYVDLTAEQFDLYSMTLFHEPNEQMDRKYCGQNADTQKRFELLLSNIEAYLNEE